MITTPILDVSRVRNLQLKEYFLLRIPLGQPTIVEIIYGTLQNQSPDMASDADAAESNDETKQSDTFNLIEREGEQTLANVEPQKVISVIKYCSQKIWRIWHQPSLTFLKLVDFNLADHV